jgi:(E)-4-hydroxy-3-methylbut-2-enyl-diphosphate synthase
MNELQRRLGSRKTAVKVSVLGCVVNGPGEAREADLGIAAGKGKGVIFKRGEIVRHVLEHEMVDALLEEIETWEREEAEKGHLKSQAPATGNGGRVKLPLVAG